MSFRLIGRVIFAIPVILIGANHLSNASVMAFMVPSWLPGGIFWVYLTGSALIVAAVAIIAGRMTYYAALGLAVLVFIFALTIHLPGMMKGDGPMRMFSTLSFYKDLAISGAALFIAGHARLGNHHA